MRREQERAERRAAQQRSAPAPSMPSVSTRSGNEPRGGGSLLKPRWATDIISELRKVTWPTRQETSHLTLVVIVVSLLFGIVLGSADLGLNWVIQHTLLR
jgi:preprotein translocase SecE subunit